MPLDDLVFAAGRELGGPWEFNMDLNAGRSLGTGYVQATIGGGERSDASTAYLHPAMERPNLHVLANTQVTRVLPVGTSPEEQTDFRVVEMAQDRKGVLTLPVLGFAMCDIETGN